MKKHFIFLTAIAVASLASCQKNVSSVPEEPVFEGPVGVVKVSVVTPVQLTRASTDAILDSKINSIQLFVFDDHGKLETSRYEASYDGTDALTLTTKTGVKTIYAVLNSKRLNFSTLNKFETEANLAYNDLSENSVTNLLMVGKNTIDVAEFDKNKNASAQAQSLQVRVKRLAAKVQLDQIIVNFDNTMLEGGQLAIQDIYLVNVVGKSPYGVQNAGLPGDQAPTTGIPIALPSAMLSDMGNWYNKGTLQSPATSAPAVTYDQGLGDTFVCSGNYVKGTAKAMNRVFLAYPNPSENYQNTPSPAAPVHTALVIKGRLKSGSLIDTPVDKDTYYTFDLPAIEANKVYQITKIKISMAGADTPGERVITGSIDGSVVVDQWSDTIPLSYDF